MRILALIAVVACLVGVTTSANATIDNASIKAVGFSIQFGHQSHPYNHKHRRHRRYNPYGYGYFPGFPYYYDQSHRFQNYGWSRHGHQYKHHGKHRTKRRWHKRH